MTFLTFRPADVLHSNRVYNPRLQFPGIFSINAVEFISLYAGGTVGEVDPGCPMAVDAPAHAEGRELPDFVHFLNRSMAGLAWHFAGSYVLCMAEKHVVWKVMNFYPFDRFSRLGISSFFGVVTGIAV